MKGLSYSCLEPTNWGWGRTFILCYNLVKYASLLVAKWITFIFGNCIYFGNFFLMEKAAGEFTSIKICSQIWTIQIRYFHPRAYIWLHAHSFWRNHWWLEQECFENKIKDKTFVFCYKIMGFAKKVPEFHQHVPHD